MPYFEFSCLCGSVKTVQRPFGNVPRSALCQVCGESMQRIFSAPAIQFKGKGFSRGHADKEELDSKSHTQRQEWDRKAETGELAEEITSVHL